MVAVLSKTGIRLMPTTNYIEDMLCDELEHIATQKELTPNDLDTLDVSIDILKDIKTIKAMDQEYPDDGYSQGYGRMPVYMYDDMGMGQRGNSYARGRDSRGRYMSNGYSRNDGYSGDTKEELQRLMSTAKNEREREAIKNALDHMDR